MDLAVHKFRIILHQDCPIKKYAKFLKYATRFRANAFVEDSRLILQTENVYKSCLVLLYTTSDKPLKKKIEYLKKKKLNFLLQSTNSCVKLVGSSGGNILIQMD